MAKIYPTGVRPHGTGIEISYQWEGRRYYEKLERKPNNTNFALASKIRQQRIDSLRLGQTDAGPAPTFFELADMYLQTLNCARATAMSYHSLLNRYWLPVFAERRINTIKFSNVLAAVNAVDWPSGKTRKNALIPLRGVFGLALADGTIDSNPVAQIKQQKHQKPTIDPVLPEEWAAISKHLSGDALDYFTLAWETGMRHPGEIIALNWEDFKGDTLMVSKAIVRRRMKDTKTYSARTVLLTPAAQKVLRNRSTRFQRGAIFKNTLGRHHLDGDIYNNAWKAAIKAAGVRPRIAYNLRHGWASRALTAGMNPAFVASQLGHSLEMTLNVYGKFISSSKDRDELKKMEMWQECGRDTSAND